MWNILSCYVVSMDGYAFHVKLYVLEALQRNDIMVIAIQSHTFYKLQPLDLSVFGTFSFFLQQEFHRGSRQNDFFDVFDLFFIIAVVDEFGFFHHSSGVQKELKRIKISSGYMLAGAWITCTRSVNPSALAH